jgi:hypothetical protein
MLTEIIKYREDECDFFSDTTLTYLPKDANRKFVWLALPHEPEAAPNEWASR